MIIPARSEPHTYSRVAWEVDVENHLSSLAKTFHVFRIVSEIFGQALQRTGKVARQVVTRDRAGRRLLVQTLFEAFHHKRGFRHPPGLGLSSEPRVELIRQLH